MTQAVLYYLFCEKRAIPYLFLRDELYPSDRVNVARIPRPA